MDKGLEVYKEVITRNLEDIPKLLIENDNKINWVHGGMYTLKPKKGKVENLGHMVVMYQELEVYNVGKLGEREPEGATHCVMVIEDKESIEQITSYEESPEYEVGKLGQLLQESVDEQIKGYGEGITEKGCTFFTNDGNALLTKGDILLEIGNKFQQGLDDLFVRLLVEEEFDKGEYRLDIEGLEVGYRETDGWGILLITKVQNYKTMKKKGVELLFSTYVKEKRDDVVVEDIKNIVLRVLDKFKQNNKESEHFGVIFHMGGISDTRKEKEKDIYIKIRGTQEDTDRWAERFVQVMDNHKQDLNKSFKDIKVVKGFGFKFTTQEGKVVVFSEGGIMLDDGTEIYIKKETNLQEGLMELANIIGKENYTLEAMKTYDYRKKIAKGVESKNG